MSLRNNYYETINLLLMDRNFLVERSKEVYSACQNFELPFNANY